MLNLSPRQLWALVLLTVIWGLNWPVMKAGVSVYPPLAFRAVTMWMGLPILAAILIAMRLPFSIPRAYWGRVVVLAFTNMIVWHTLLIVALPQLTSGRAAILGYTMPIFAALVGRFWLGQQLGGRAWAGVAAAACGVVLLLWNALTSLGSTVGALLVLLAAACWAVGTHLMRLWTVPVSTLTLTFWFSILSASFVTVLSLLWGGVPPWPSDEAWMPILYNVILVFGLAQPVWFFLVRGLPPMASSLSVMMIPVLGVFSGAWWLGEQLAWQDWAAVVLMAAAIASVLLPARGGAIAATDTESSDKKGA